MTVLRAQLDRCDLRCESEMAATVPVNTTTPERYTNEELIALAKTTQTGQVSSDLTTAREHAIRAAEAGSLEEINEVYSLTQTIIRETRRSKKTSRHRKSSSTTLGAKDIYEKIWQWSQRYVTVTDGQPTIVGGDIAISDPETRTSYAKLMNVLGLISPSKTDKIMWWTLSAELGNVNSMVNLAAHYELQEKQPSKSLKWELLAAEAGHDRSHYILARRYIYGKGVDKDHAKGIEYLKRAAETVPSAMSWLGTIYGSRYMSRLYGVDNIPAKAVEYITRASDSGNTMAMVKLAEYYRRGITTTNGVTDGPSSSVSDDSDDSDKKNSTVILERDPLRALELLEMAYAKSGQKHWYQWKLGEFHYAEGHWTEAISIYHQIVWEESASQYYQGIAYWKLGQCYNLGHGVPVDLTKALEMYENAARCGHRRSQRICAAQADENITHELDHLDMVDVPDPEPLDDEASTE